MKNETARREIESLDYYLQNHTDDYSEESHTAMMMGIKALEQEPILDKIRTEIKDIAFDSQEIDGEHESIMIVELNDALNIIDKYKAESENP